jgi:hypothetical protein
MSLPSSPAASDGSGELLAGLLRRVSSTRTSADTRLISNAYEVAAYWHQGQKRKSGDPYITHPVAVAAILAETGADDPTLCAALLHDVTDTTPYTLAALRGKFGAEIAYLVGAAMALDMLPPDQVTAAYTESAAAVALAGDERVLQIKLADRLHNTRTVEYLPRAKQVLKSRYTLEAMVPLARVLQMETISSELENLAFAVLRRHGRRPRTASGRLLAATATLLPGTTRARWREEWLAELHTLSSRRERLTFAAQIVLGVGRLALTLYQPTNAGKRIGSAVLAAAVAAAAFTAGGWRATTALAATVIAVLTTLSWILTSDDRTARLSKLINVLRNTTSSDPGPRVSGRSADQPTEPARRHLGGLRQATNARRIRKSGSRHHPPRPPSG